jgi:hypothetical protein
MTDTLNDMLPTESEVDRWIVSARGLFLQKVQAKADEADLSEEGRLAYVAAALDSFERDCVPDLRKKLRTWTGQVLH